MPANSKENRKNVSQQRDFIILNLKKRGLLNEDNLKKVDAIASSEEQLNKLYGAIAILVAFHPPLTQKNFDLIVADKDPAIKACLAYLITQPMLNNTKNTKTENNTTQDTKAKNSTTDKLLQNASAKLCLSTATDKKLKHNPSAEKIIEEAIKKIKSLRIVYANRVSNNNEFNGRTSGGRYKPASILTTKVAAFFGQAFSAKDKLTAADEILRYSVDDIKEIGSKNNAFDPKKFSPAARQGELGKCFKAIADAQKEISNSPVAQAKNNA